MTVRNCSEWYAPENKLSEMVSALFPNIGQAYQINANPNAMKKNILKFPSQNDKLPFFKEIMKNGYHVFSRENAKVPDYYPSKFPDYPGVDLQHLNIGDVITIRVFFRIGTGEYVRADGGYLDLEVEHIEDDAVFGVILTQLPKKFPLQTGSSLEIYPDEILYKAQITTH
ncbi:hypothetical protein [Desulfobulbus sp.]|uniref:hypothetical protein n=1 Tax=Desulfobulbus sp. TaxID=895 RepID=UPI00286F6541|nr:hypothetical protein [Desulfobulbus sp.]